MIKLRTLFATMVLGTAIFTGCAADTADTADMADEETESAESALNVAGELIPVGAGSWVWAGHMKPGQTNLRAQLQMLIDQQVGGTIHITLFRLDQTIYDALIRAKQRNVTVYAATDGKVYDDADNNTYLRKLKTHLKERNTICRGGPDNGSCLSPGNPGGAKLHAKLALFSNSSWVGGRKMPVAYVASMNFSDGPNSSGIGMYNNAMMFFNPVQGYSRLKGYFDDLLAEKRVADYYQGPVCSGGACSGALNGRGHAIDSSVGTQFFFGPDGGGAGNRNIVETVLGLYDAGGQGKKCQVRVSQGAIVDGTGIVNALIAHKESGCEVHVMTSMETEAPVIARMVRAGIEVRRNAKQHNKFYAISARHKATNQWHWVVWSGSRQATANSMYVNDEISTFSGGNAAWAEKLYTNFFHGFGPIWGDPKSETCKSNGVCK